jgi:hypothetical protein
MSEIRKRFVEQLQEASSGFPAEPDGPVPARNREPAGHNGASEKSYPDPSRNGADFLSKYLEASPFIDLFERYAASQYVGKYLQVKVFKLRTVHPGFYRLCMTLDTVVRVIVVGSLLAIAFVAAYKVLSPLPAL